MIPSTSPGPRQQPFRLQREVVFDGVRLADSLTGHAHFVSPLAMQVVGLDVATSGDEAIVHVARANNVNRSEIERELRQLLLLGLLEGSCADARGHLRQLRRGEPLEERVLPGSRLGCCGSGACCHGWVFGPVTAQEKTRIESLPLREHLPYIGEGPWLQPMNSVTGTPTYRLATRGEACVFLDEQSRCGLHTAFGAHAKPDFCQLFPLSSVATIDGLKIFDRGECASFAVSARSGELIEDHMPAVRHLLPQELYHPRVTLEGNWRCDYSLVLRLARRLDDDIRSLAPGRALQALGQRIRNFTSALVHCSLVQGQPDCAASKVLETPLSEPGFTVQPDAAAAKSGAQRFAELAHALAARTPIRASFAAHLNSVAAHVAGFASAAERQPKDVPRIPEPVDFALTFSMRQQIFGHELLLDGSLPAGLLRILCVTVFSRLLAQSRAASDARSLVSDVDLGVSHMQVKRALSHPALRECLLEQAEDVWVILDALRALGVDCGLLI